MAKEQPFFKSEFGSPKLCASLRRFPSNPAMTKHFLCFSLCFPEASRRLRLSMASSAFFGRCLEAGLLPLVIFSR
jgi:hypothetical protein